MTLAVEISEEAEHDLEEVFDYTYSEHEMNQTVEYVSSFDPVFQNLALNPQLGRERMEIREGLRCHVKDLHVIFYRIKSDCVRIVRVLHGAQDLAPHFAKNR